MRGEPWKYFNLISSPQLSLNAQFLPVPAEYVGASGRLSQFSDTVLGTLHLAACIPGTPRAVGVLFDVFDGAMHCTVGGARAFEGDMEAVRETVPCEWALEASGLSAELEVAACAMSTMSCGYTKVRPKDDVDPQTGNPQTGNPHALKPPAGSDKLHNPL